MSTVLLIPASVGDVLDRITILVNKAGQLTGPAKANVEAELSALRAAWPSNLPAPEAVPQYAELDRVNRALWDVEDRLRAAEAILGFGPEFIADARSVYRLNDQRAALKRAINLLYHSGVVEEKLHPRY